MSKDQVTGVKLGVGGSKEFQSEGSTNAKTLRQDHPSGFEESRRSTLTVVKSDVGRRQITAGRRGRREREGREGGAKCLGHITGPGRLPWGGRELQVSLGQGSRISTIHP